MTACHTLFPSSFLWQNRMSPLLPRLRALITTAALLVSGASAAQTLNFDVTAEITNSTCQIAAGDEDRDIELPHVDLSRFVTPGTAIGHREFTLSLINCAPTLSQVGLNFTGTADADSDMHFANAGTAAGIAMQLASTADNRIIGLDGTSSSRIMPINNGNASLDLRASYWRSPRAISAGSLSSQAVFEITYP